MIPCIDNQSFANIGKVIIKIQLIKETADEKNN